MKKMKEMKRMKGMKKIFLLLFVALSVAGRIYPADLIGVTSPYYCSDIAGNTTIEIYAPAYSEVTVKCWKQGEGFGLSSEIGTVALDSEGKGSIVFPADEYPHGPTTLTISGVNSDLYEDNCYLQLYNTGGISWCEGMPDETPPPAEGMTLVFADDFDSELSIGSNSEEFRYYDHKPPGGWEDFSSIPFTDFNNPKNPFSQVDSYLRIRADANKGSSGLISSLFSDREGFMVMQPSYFECRLIGPNAIGSWPAFWLLSVKDNITEYYEPCDELDIIEAYGGEGPGAPNSKQRYQVNSHAWSQPGSWAEDLCWNFYVTKSSVDVYQHGIPSTWYETSHIYGCKITEEATIYYCDNIEVARHESLPISLSKPFYFMINLATGGGWPTDLSRYGGVIDMYVDYVRVYNGEPTGLDASKIEDIDLAIYPNPVKSTATIALHSSGLEEVNIEVCNVLGESVLSRRVRQQGKVEIPVDLSAMSKGIYFIKINRGNSQTVKTVIKN
jgi:hypothetical protein